jgi:hypothetical protein
MPNGDSPTERLRRTQRGTVPICRRGTVPVFRTCTCILSGREQSGSRPRGFDTRGARGIIFVVTMRPVNEADQSPSQSLASDEVSRMLYGLAASARPRSQARVEQEQAR